jgi:hypothetical protein
VLRQVVPACIVDLDLDQRNRGVVWLEAPHYAHREVKPLPILLDPGRFPRML